MCLYLEVIGSSLLLACCGKCDLIIICEVMAVKKNICFIIIYFNIINCEIILFILNKGQK